MNATTSSILADCERQYAATRERERATPHHRYPNLSEAEGRYIDQISRWGSAAYPVAKRGSSWWVDDLCGIGACPSGFKTKRDAVAFVERYHELILDKLAGRL